MRYFILFFLSLMTSFAFAGTRSSDNFLFHKGRCLIIVANEDEIIKESNILSACEGIQIQSVPIAIDKGGLRRKLRPLFINKAVNQETIFEIKRAIVEYFQSEGYPFIVVEVPHQEVTSGVLQFVVKESRIGKIKIDGGSSSARKFAKKYLSLKAGESINEKALFDDLNFINRNPFRRATLIFSEGTKPYTTDLLVTLDERKIWRLYTGAENTGLVTTGRQRWVAGLNWGRVFGLDHVFSYQFTTATSMREFQAHTAQYMMLLPWENILSLYGGYSRVHADLPITVVSNKGKSGQASLRYTVPFGADLYLKHEVGFGADYKITDSTLDVSEDLFQVGQTVNIFQFMGEYALMFQKSKSRLNFQAQIFWQPGRMLPHQTDADYQSLRPDAKNKWVYMKGQLFLLQRFAHDLKLFVKASGQWASQNLLPSEQFDLGGMNSVRGYDEREVNKDSAFLANVEFMLPIFKILNYRWKNIHDAMEFLVFWDYGIGWNHDPIPFEKKNQWLMGIGPGLRYTIDPYLTARVDWGIRLHKAPSQFEGGNSRLHFSLILSY